MMFNIALDFGVGLIPILGDVADAIYRANTRNAWLLEAYLAKKAEAQRIGSVEDEKLGTIRLPTRPSAVKQVSSMGLRDSDRPGKKTSAGRRDGHATKHRRDRDGLTESH